MRVVAASATAAVAAGTKRRAASPPAHTQKHSIKSTFFEPFEFLPVKSRRRSGRSKISRDPDSASDSDSSDSEDDDSNPLRFERFQELGESKLLAGTRCRLFCETRSKILACADGARRDTQRLAVDEIASHVRSCRNKILREEIDGMYTDHHHIRTALIYSPMEPRDVLPAFEILQSELADLSPIVITPQHLESRRKALSFHAEMFSSSNDSNCSVLLVPQYDAASISALSLDAFLSALVASPNRKRKVILVLFSSATIDMLRRNMPSKTFSRLLISQFQLAPAPGIAAAFYTEVFLSPTPILRLGPKSLSFILNRFAKVSSSVEMMVNMTIYAALQYYTTTPLSILLHPADNQRSQIKQSLERFSPDMRTYACAHFSHAKETRIDASGPDLDSMVKAFHNVICSLDEEIALRQIAIKMLSSRSSGQTDLLLTPYLHIAFLDRSTSKLCVAKRTHALDHTRSSLINARGDCRETLDSLATFLDTLKLKMREVKQSRFQSDLETDLQAVEVFINRLESETESPTSCTVVIKRSNATASLPSLIHDTNTNSRENPSGHSALQARAIMEINRRQRLNSLLATALNVDPLHASAGSSPGATSQNSSLAREAIDIASTITDKWVNRLADWASFSTDYVELYFDNVQALKTAFACPITLCMQSALLYPEKIPSLCPVDALTKATATIFEAICESHSQQFELNKLFTTIESKASSNGDKNTAISRPLFEEVVFNLECMGIIKIDRRTHSKCELIWDFKL